MNFTVFIIITVINLIFIMISWKYVFNTDNKKYFINYKISIPISFLVVVIVYIINVFIIKVQNFNEPNELLLIYVLTIPFVEELVKGLLLLQINRLNKFESISQGMLTGVMVGLVFAFVENIIYSNSAYILDGNNSLALTIFLRGIATPLGHPLYTGLIGVGIAASNYFDNIQLIPIFIKSYLLHVAWNFAALTPELISLSSYTLIFLLYIMIISILITTLIREKSYVKRFDKLIIDNNLKFKIHS